MRLSIRHHVSNKPVPNHECDRSDDNSSSSSSRLCSYRSSYSPHPADCSSSGLPALPVSLPQQRRLQDDGGAGSRRGPRRGSQQPGRERKEGIFHINPVKISKSRSLWRTEKKHKSLALFPVCVFVFMKAENLVEEFCSDRRRGAQEAIPKIVLDGGNM